MSKAFDRAMNWLTMKSDYAQEPRHYDHGIYIYGAGDLGVLAAEYCDACNISVLGFFDKSRDGVITTSSGRSFPIFHPTFSEVAVDKRKIIAVAIATQPFNPIRNTLLGLGWSDVVPFYHLCSEPSNAHPLKNGWRLGNVTSEEICIARTVFQNWADDKSRLHYESFLAWHRNYTEIELEDAPISINERYVIPDVLAALRHRSNQLVDIGAHVGESVRRMSAANLTFNDYIAFEPDAASRAILNVELKGVIPSGARYKINSRVLASCRQEVRFQTGSGYCSQIWQEGNEPRVAWPLDDFNVQPDYLKIHTEGSEADILAGAKETIKKSRPVIVYSVYHRREGFYQDILSTMTTACDYKWIFRLHGFQGTGAYVYGIPLT